jgi:3-oxoacyl-[acyl-carrier protein] reductase
MTAGELDPGDRRVVVVTGGCGGIGAAVVSRFEAAGAIVVSMDLRASGRDDVSEPQGRNPFIECDIADPASVDTAFDDVARRFGRLDVLANVAGVDDPAAKNRMADLRSRSEPLDITATLSNEQWRRMISVNLDGTFYCMRAALVLMIRQRSGVIVNVSSIAGVEGRAGFPHYSAAKAGVLGLTRAVAKEVAEFGIRVNAVAPGPVSTPMAQRSIAVGLGIEMPLGQMATPDDVAAAIEFLAGPSARAITGETVNLNGGLLTV